MQPQLCLGLQNCKVIMSKINKSIEVVASTTHELNSMTTASRSGIQTVLLQQYSNVRITIINNLADLESLALRAPDLVFLGMKYVRGIDSEKIWLSEYLDSKGITYTGSGHPAIRLELDKQLAKQRILDMGLSTPRFQIFIHNSSVIEQDVNLKYPVFIKPSNRGGGAGVDENSLAYNLNDLQSKVTSLSQVLQADALVEEFLPGREFSVGILKKIDSDEYHVMPLELIAPASTNGERFLSSQVKSADTETHQAITDLRLKAQVSDLALNAFNALGARDYGRIDIRLAADGTPHFLEANLLPSLLSGYGNFPKACMLNLQMAHQDAILRIVQLALRRSAPKKKLLENIINMPLLQPISTFTIPVSVA
jgi:D-alanine-D-alanine ligase